MQRQGEMCLHNFTNEYFSMSVCRSTIEVKRWLKLTSPRPCFTLHFVRVETVGQRQASCCKQASTTCPLFSFASLRQTAGMSCQTLMQASSFPTFSPCFYIVLWFNFQFYIFNFSFIIHLQSEAKSLLILLLLFYKEKQSLI